MDSISIANNSLFSVHGRRCLIIALFGIFDVLKSLDGDFARMMKEIHSLRQNVTILETETESLKFSTNELRKFKMFNKGINVKELDLLIHSLRRL
uniref:Uncharacterized protein n=1 Tax=Glossina pallidipes TaxID=7398 RepID=A0A1A9ZQN7_GLOPL